MSFPDAAAAHTHAHLDQLVTIRTYDRGWSLRRRRTDRPDPSLASATWTAWCRRQGGGVQVEAPAEVGSDFSALVAEGLVVRYDDRLVGRAPNSITAELSDGTETVIRRVVEAGRRRYLVLVP